MLFRAAQNSDLLLALTVKSDTCKLLEHPELSLLSRGYRGQALLCVSFACSSVSGETACGGDEDELVRVL